MQERGKLSSGQAQTHNRQMRLAMLLAVFVLLAACEQAQPSPTSWATFSPSATIFLRTLPIPTRAPTKTATQIYLPPSSYDLPTWMSDPNTMILADLIINGYGQNASYEKLSFLNAETGEWYDMQAPPNGWNYFWYDNMHFGLLSDDFQTMYLMDLGTGQVSSTPVLPKATRLLEPISYFSALQIKQDPLSTNEFVFDYVDPFSFSGFSSDSRYYAERDRSQEEDQIIVTDLETGKVVWESNPSDGYFDNVLAWSPVNGSYLAIVQGKTDQSVDFWFPVKDTTLIVLDVETGEIVSSIRGDIGRVVWSPDGTNILYKNAISNYATFGYGFTEAPCIFNIQTGENKCALNIPNRHIPTGYSLETTSDYQWSPDGQSIYYVYFYRSTSGMAGNICIYDLLTGSIICPTDNLAELQGWEFDWPVEWGYSIRLSDFSPDGEFIHFCYSSNSLLSDDASGPSRDGLIDINGTKIISWNGWILDDTPQCSFWGIWRPLP